jgi:hypothetical protein
MRISPRVTTPAAPSPLRLPTPVLPTLAGAASPRPVPGLDPRCHASAATALVDLQLRDPHMPRSPPIHTTLVHPSIHPTAHQHVVVVRHVVVLVVVHLAGRADLRGDTHTRVCMCVCTRGTALPAHTQPRGCRPWLRHSGSGRWAWPVAPLPFCWHTALACYPPSLRGPCYHLPLPSCLYLAIVPPTLSSFIKAFFRLLSGYTVKKAQTARPSAHLEQLDEGVLHALAVAQRVVAHDQVVARLWGGALRRPHQVVSPQPMAASCSAPHPDAARRGTCAQRAHSYSLCDSIYSRS